MSVVNFNAALDSAPLKLVVPYPPEFAASELHSLHSNIAGTALSANTAAEDSAICEKRWQSSNATQDIVSTIDELQCRLQLVESYLRDLEGYARFWRELALKHIRESRQNIRLVYAPFCDIGRQ